jgi:DNA-binding MurR/RpiR family transcriptional regulator
LRTPKRILHQRRHVNGDSENFSSGAPLTPLRKELLNCLQPAKTGGNSFCANDSTHRLRCHPHPLRQPDSRGTAVGRQDLGELSGVGPRQHHCDRGKRRRFNADRCTHGSEAGLQGHLHHELEETLSNPISKHDRWALNAPGTHILNRFADAITANLRDTLSALDTTTFEDAAALLGDRERSVYFVGGRITGALAEYFFTHMQVIRPKTSLISTNSSSWPQHVLNMKPGDVLVIFDIRRYEQEMATLAEVAKASGVIIILMTDVWGSPVAKHARHTFRVRIEAPSAWDSSVVTLFVVEALIEAVQSAAWDRTRERMNSLEDLFERSRLFRRHNRQRPE